jgi:nitrite reductase/ring-hydroxylating ferredoxin subunit
VQIQLQFTLSEAPAEWDHEVGRVSVRMIQSFFPPPRADVHIFWCGPPGFHEHLRLCTSQIGYPAASLHEFMGLIGGQALAPAPEAESTAMLSDTKADATRSVSLTSNTSSCESGVHDDSTSVDSTSVPVFVRALGPGLPAEGDRTHVAVQGRHVTVFREVGRLYCMDSICYHAGGPLTIGDIEDVAMPDGENHLTVVCPWHTYHVRLDTGQRMFRGLKPVDGKLVPTGWECAAVKQRVHEVEDRQDGVYVRLSSTNSDKECDDGPEIESDQYAYDVRYTHNLGASRGGRAHVGKDGSMQRGKRNMQRSGHVLQRGSGAGPGSNKGGLANYRNKY